MEQNKTGYDAIRTSLYMDREKYRELKIYCVTHGITVNGLIKALLDKYMKEVAGE